MFIFASTDPLIRAQCGPCSQRDTTDGRRERASTSSIQHAVMMAFPERNSIMPVTVTGQHHLIEAEHPSTSVPSFGQKSCREGRAVAIRTEEPKRTDMKEDDRRATDRVAKPPRLTRDGTTA